MLTGDPTLQKTEFGSGPSENRNSDPTLQKTGFGSASAENRIRIRSFKKLDSDPTLQKTGFGSDPSWNNRIRAEWFTATDIFLNVHF